MSLILEALRKSEAERQVGRLPGLMTPTLPLRRPRRRWKRWLLLPLALLIAAGSWWLGRQGVAPTPLPATAVIANDAVPGATEVPTGVALAEPTPALSSAPAVTASVPRAATSDDPARSAPAASSPPESATPPAIERIPAPPAAVTTSAEPAPTATASPAAPSAPTPIAAVPAPTAGATPPVPAEPAEPAPPSLLLMPAAQRQALPTLKLSVHVFAGEPSRRFAVIDGRRVQAGDRLGDIEVVAIRRDGVQLGIGTESWLLERAR